MLATVIKRTSLYAAIALIILIIATVIPFGRPVIQKSLRPLAQALSSQSSSLLRGPKRLNSSLASNISAPNMKTPVYYFSHGGPNLFEDVEHPAHKFLKELGREITTKVQPKAIVVFSAHWEGEKDTVYVNTAEITPLIYDFYGFPQHYYEVQYQNSGSKDLADKVVGYLTAAGIKSEEHNRGLDHGVWVPFYCAFNPKENPVTVPIVQVSLFDSDDGDQHYRLGQAISALREEGVQVIVSGMAVHNLQELWKGPMPRPYTITFDQALKEAVEVPASERQQAMAALLRRSDARRAHPRFDHLMPIYIGAGAAGDDVGKQLFTLHEGSMSWAQYRFGEVSA